VCAVIPSFLLVVPTLSNSLLLSFYLSFRVLIPFLFRFPVLPSFFLPVRCTLLGPVLDLRNKITLVFYYSQPRGALNVLIVPGPLV